MKVMIIILVLVVFILMLTQTITRFEVMRLREKEVAYDAQIEVLQRKYADIQMNMEACLKDVHRVIKESEANKKACVDVFSITDEHISKLQERFETHLENSAKRKKQDNKPEGAGEQQ